MKAQKVVKNVAEKWKNEATDNNIGFSESRLAVEENDTFVHLNTTSRPENKRGDKFNTTGDKNAHEHPRKHDKGVIK
jgi:hypothetical protein